MAKNKKRFTNLKLKAAIIESGLSLEEFQLSPEINIPRTTFSRKMNGWEEFKESEIMRICKKLNKEPTEIFFNYELPNEQQEKGA